MQRPMKHPGEWCLLYNEHKLEHNSSPRRDDGELDYKGAEQVKLNE